MAAETLDRARRKLRRFARTDTETSPLYSHLAERAAEDTAVAGLLTATNPEDAEPTLLFAAVHRTLQAHPFHELVNYYPSMGGMCGPDGATWGLFRSFVLEHAEEIRTLIASRTVQTNEVGRAALVYPAVALAAGRAPVGLLEVGCSAGLLLNLDRYGYRYQTERAGQLVAGPAKPAVGLHCALSVAGDAELPAIPKKITIAARVGLDRKPVDLADEEQYAWLEACVWADQPERQRQFAAAAAAQRGNRPELVTGDAVDDLAAVAGRVPAELPLVVLTSVTLLYLSPRRQRDFLAALADLAAHRPVTWVSHDVYDTALAHVLPDRDDLRPGPGEQSFGVLGLVRWTDGRPAGRALARTAWHGQRMTWLAGR